MFTVLQALTVEAAVSIDPQVLNKINIDFVNVPQFVSLNPLFEKTVLQSGFAFQIARAPKDAQRQKICRPKKAIYVLFSNKLQLVVFDLPIPLPVTLHEGSVKNVYQHTGQGLEIDSEKLWTLGDEKQTNYIFCPPDRKKLKKKGATPVSTFAFGHSQHGPMVKYSNAPPVITLGNSFVRKQLVLDYARLSSLGPGEVLDASLMEWAFSRKLAALGFPKNDAGDNCLTNYDLVIPLIKPRNWSEEVFEPIRGLSSINSRYWSTFLAYLHGKSVELVAEEGDWLSIESEGEERSEGDRQLPKEVPKSVELGECYSGSYKHIKIVGRYIIFVVELPDKEVEILDSPFKEVAVRGFPLGKAIRYVQADSTAEREEADKCRLFRFYHSGSWEKRIELALENA